MQRTIGKPVSAQGVGLHTGCEVSVTLRPAPPDTGLIFRRTDLQGFEIEALRKHVSRVVLATTLMKRGVMLSTVEHLLSALYGQGIDNCYIDIDSLEVPIMDGSAQPFVELLQEAGSKAQDAERLYLQVEETLRLEEGDKFIEIRPFGGFRISYKIDFQHPCIGRQRFDMEIDPESYAREVAFARTFGFFQEVEQLLKSGLVRGGSLENAVVLSEEGIMNGQLRAEDEFVRHKVLDLIGDISLCGRPVVGHIVACKAGHALHTRLATELARNPSLSRLRRESRLAPAS
ncbi:MAG TPA: UDP-3-O-acyl-N-acetylglucosamine deacetylase [Acidobacteriota bacterium]|nr:UDP-3-O-acyl-N-acetylglucosamine deacetylase [Acidobacteriota bacterium]